MYGAALAALVRMRGKAPLPETGNEQRATGLRLLNSSQQQTGNGQPGAPPLSIGSNIADRLLGLATSTAAVLKTLPKNVQGRHVTTQLFRAVTAGGANYEEARSAESRADFVHKLAIAIKELRETIFWLRLIESTSLSPAPLGSLIAEAHELIAILGASVRTARKREQ